jgi:hypothetical protein
MTDGAAAVDVISDFRLFRDLEGVIDLDAEVPHGRLKLGVPEERCTARRFSVRR